MQRAVIDVFVHHPVASNVQIPQTSGAVDPIIHLEAAPNSARLEPHPYKRSYYVMGHPSSSKLPN
jgi:hypothetical protein